MVQEPNPGDPHPFGRAPPPSIMGSPTPTLHLSLSICPALCHSVLQHFPASLHPAFPLGLGFQRHFPPSQATCTHQGLCWGPAVP